MAYRRTYGRRSSYRRRPVFRRRFTKRRVTRYRRGGVKASYGRARKYVAGMGRIAAHAAAQTGVLNMVQRAVNEIARGRGVQI